MFKLNGIDIVEWDPDNRPADKVMYHKITTREPDFESAVKSLQSRFEALPEENISKSWGYWDVIVKHKKNVNFVAFRRYDPPDESRIDFYLMGPSGRGLQMSK